MSDEDEIRQLIMAWSRAVRTGDLPTVLAQHTDGIVMFDVPPPERGVLGIRAYEETWPPFFEWQASGSTFELDELQVVAGANVAYAYALAPLLITSTGRPDVCTRSTAWVRKSSQSQPAPAITESPKPTTKRIGPVGVAGEAAGAEAAGEPGEAAVDPLDDGADTSGPGSRSRVTTTTVTRASASSTDTTTNRLARELTAPDCHPRWSVAPHRPAHPGLRSEHHRRVADGRPGQARCQFQSRTSGRSCRCSTT